MPTKTNDSQPTDFLNDMQGKAMEAVAAFAQANQRVVQEFVELSVTAAKEGMRAYAELQTNVVDAVRASQPTMAAQRATVEEFQSDPFTWYQKGLLTAVDGTQKTFRLLEANAQVVTRSAERLQASAERTGKEIQEALTSYIGRMKEIYGKN